MRAWRGRMSLLLILMGRKSEKLHTKTKIFLLESKEAWMNHWMLPVWGRAQFLCALAVLICT